jgi:hypothetical protein
MNAVAVVAVAVAAGALTEVELDALLLLLEPPHPDSARMASGTAKMIFLLTGFVLSFDEPRAQRAHEPEDGRDRAPRWRRGAEPGSRSVGGALSLLAAHDRASRS